MSSFFDLDVRAPREFAMPEFSAPARRVFKPEAPVRVENFHGKLIPKAKLEAINPATDCALGSNGNYYTSSASSGAPEGPHGRPEVPDNSRDFSAVRSGLWRLKEAGSRYLGRRGNRCHKVRIQSDVTLAGYSDKKGNARACFRGLETCKDINTCPLCAHRIRTVRAQELGEQCAAYAQHYGGNHAVSMLTLTLAHSQNDDLGELQKAMSKCWNRVTTELWKKTKRRVADAAMWGLKGFVRALEVTHGKNGFHPHFHVLLFWTQAMDDDALAPVRQRISELWAQAVVKYLSEDHRPHDRIGVDLRPCKTHSDVAKAAEYVSKLGFEVTDIVSKAGRRAPGDDRKRSRAPFELLAAASEGDESAAKAWLHYRERIKGRRVMEYSRRDKFKDYLRKLAGQDEEKTDEQVMNEGENAVELCRIPADMWQALAKTRGARCEFLRRTERGGAGAAFLWAKREGIWPTVEEKWGREFDELGPLDSEAIVPRSWGPS